MELICLFGIIVSVILISAATTKNKRTPSNQREAVLEEQQVKARSERPKVAAAKRIRESANKSRIHRNIKNADTQKSDVSEAIEESPSVLHNSVKNLNERKVELKIDTKDIMLSVKEIMVCGYPVNIPGQRDFVKEGEDFLEGFKTNSLFL